MPPCLSLPARDEASPKRAKPGATASTRFPSFLAFGGTESRRLAQQKLPGRTLVVRVSCGFLQTPSSKDREWGRGHGRQSGAVVGTMSHLVLQGSVCRGRDNQSHASTHGSKESEHTARSERREDAPPVPHPWGAHGAHGMVCRRASLQPDPPPDVRTESSPGLRILKTTQHYGVSQHRLAGGRPIWQICQRLTR